MEDFPLAGYEAHFSMSPSAFWIGHAVLVSGPIAQLVDALPAAFMSTANRHPRMRATIPDPSKPTVGRIKPQISLEDAAKLVSVIDCAGDEDRWMKVLEEGCEERTDRTTKLPFRVTLCKVSEDSARMILFSDHTFSDGFSGMVVTDEILTAAASLIDEPYSGSKETKSLPLQPPILHQMWPQSRFQKIVDRLLIAIVNNSVISQMNRYSSPLELRSDVVPFALPNPKHIPSSARFAVGTEESLRAALGRCKEECTTLFGAIVTALLIAHCKTRYKTISDLPSILKAHMDADYNMRKRVKRPADHDYVGFGVGIANLAYLAKKGVKSSDRFWDAARLIKGKVDGLVGSMEMVIAPIICSTQLNALTRKSKLRCRTVSDMNVSNVGRYPFKTKHSTSKGPLEIHNLHVYNSCPHVAPSTVFFITSIKSLNLSMMSKLNNSVTDEFFTHAFSALNAIGSVSKDVTISDVFKML